MGRSPVVIAFVIVEIEVMSQPGYQFQARALVAQPPYTAVNCATICASLSVAVSSCNLALTCWLALIRFISIILSSAISIRWCAHPDQFHPRLRSQPGQ